MADWEAVNGVAASSVEKVSLVAKSSIEKINGVSTAADAAYSYENQYSVDLEADSSQYIKAGNNTDLDYTTNSFSYSFWMKPETSGPSNEWVIDKTGPFGTWAGYQIYRNSNNQLVVSFSNGGSTKLEKTTTGTAFGSGSWIHVCVVFTAGSGSGSGVKASMAVYRNGSAVSLNTGTENLYGESITSATPFAVGTRVASHPGWSQYFDGVIDELSFWNKALSSAEVTEIFNNGVPGNLTTHSATSNLTNWYRMGDDASDDLTGTSGQITDVIGSAHLTPFSTSSSNKVSETPVVYSGAWVSGKVGNYALEFAGYGSDDHVDVPTASVGSTPSAGTMACWVYVHTHSNYPMFFSQGNPTGDTNFIYWSINSGGYGTQRFAYRIDGGTATYRHSSSVVPLNTWTHIAVTVASNGHIYFYKDGAEDTANTGASWFGDLASGATKTVLGAFWVHGQADYEFDGVIDEFAVWDSVLSLSDIQALYNSGNGAAATTVSSGTLQSYYRMEDGAGSTTLTDGSGNSRNGTLTNMPT